MLRYILLVNLSLIGGLAAGQQHDFEWLIGSWKREGKNTFEVWRRADNGSDLLGRSYRLVNGDTVELEDVILGDSQGYLSYSPDVAGPQPRVHFRIVSKQPASFRAENPAHDFPKVITYTCRKENGRSMLDATIEGGGKTITYHFVKLD